MATPVLQHTHLLAGLDVVVLDDGTIDNLETAGPDTFTYEAGPVLKDEDGYIIFGFEEQFSLLAIRETGAQLRFVLQEVEDEDGNFQLPVEPHNIHIDVIHDNHTDTVAFALEGDHWQAHAHVAENKLATVRARLDTDKLSVQYVPAGQPNAVLSFGD